MVLKRCLVCVAALGLLAASPAWATITVSLDPAAQSVDISAPSVSVDIVADIPEADAIVQWGLDLSYDNLVLGLSGGTWLDAVTINTALFDVAVAPDGDELSALVPFGDAPLWGANILLATVEFVPAGLGTSPLDLSDSNAGGDLTEGFALDPPPTGAFADVTYVPGEITVTPEPGTLALLALGGLCLLRRR
jgi:hypothetical protein